MKSQMANDFRAKIHAIILITGGLMTLTPWFSSSLALGLGILIALSNGNPYSQKTRNFSQRLLSYSIVGLGAGMNLIFVAHAGTKGIGLTFVSICLTYFMGLALGRLLKTESEVSILVSVGTAICGGSAIAAVGPLIRAKPHSMSVAIGTIFLLNGIALFTFPTIGHYFGLSQSQFGLWAALAIHDTSSVVGASAQYGAEALQIGTTIKLARAIWIVPISIIIGLTQSRTSEHPAEKAKKPWFILGFILVSAFFTWMPQFSEVGSQIEFIAKKSLSLCLFLIGSNLSRENLKAVGIKPLLQGIILWLFVIGASLAFIKNQNIF